jgi:NAD(P)H-dependent FMN reductase
MINLIGLAGSLRRGSLNAVLLRAAAKRSPPESAVVIESIRGIPLYDGDVEAGEGVPAGVTALKDAIANADGLLLVTPEYNNSIPGVFKNAIDWLSRPPGDIKRVFGGKPVALMGASPGGFGTTLSQNHHGVVPSPRIGGPHSRDLPTRSERARAQASQRLDDQREAMGQVVAGAAVESARAGGVVSERDSLPCPAWPLPPARLNLRRVGERT